MAAEKYISDDDALLADTMERFMRGSSADLALQDKLAKNLKWFEGQMAAPATLRALTAKTQEVVRKFIEEHPRYGLHRESFEEALSRIQVIGDEHGRVTIDIPQEILRCLETPSPISF